MMSILKTTIKKDNDYQNQLNEIEKLIDHSISLVGPAATEDLKLFESWLSKQSAKIQTLKLKNSLIAESLLDTENLSKASHLIFDKEFNIQSFGGAFAHIVGPKPDLKSGLSFLKFVDDPKQVNQLKILIDFAMDHRRTYTFHVTMKSFSCISYDSILRLEPYENGLFKVSIDYIAFENSQFDPKTEFQNILIRNLPGMDIYLYDTDYRFLMTAGKQKEEFGFRDEDLVGKKLFEAFDETLVRKLYPFFSKAIHGLVDDGFARFWDGVFQINSFPIKDLNGNVIAGFSVVNRMVAYPEHQKPKVGNKAMDGRTKEDFVANLAHEFRTPLNGIAGFAELLERTELDGKQERFVHLIQKMSDQLLRLVDEVMYISKIDQKKITSERTTFNVRELIHEFYLQFSVQASEKEIDFSVDVDFDEPMELVGDLFHLKQILMNLLTNAFKYTESGSVRLLCDILDQTDEEVMVRFRIVDTGIGIAEEELPYIFEAFQQASNGCVKSANSAGIGLAISKKLVTILGGDIGVDSRLGEGSEFTISLPFSIASEKLDSV